ncbi:MAG: hypothetical protein BAJATHORv1_40307 [Candidatus Thorarchaeota archaeon]|nr:MAG: hypothetical protein BAJATHORv1_40307 [Candidatus Thorarchaeota archaeon]
MSKKEKMSKSVRCGYGLCLFIFAAFAGFLGLNALNQSESMDIPEIFAFVPFLISIVAFILGLCILSGKYTPSNSRYGVIAVYR